jgi:hypothetical protein
MNGARSAGRANARLTQPRVRFERLPSRQGQVEGDMEPTRRGFLAIAFLAIAGASAVGAHGMDISEDLPSFGHEGSGRPRLTLAFVDCANLPAGMLAAVQAETLALVAAMGVDGDVRTIAPGADLDPSAVTLIVMDGESPARSMAGVMGAVQRQGALPALWIFSESVATGSRLGWRGRDRWSARDADAFARAMARVAVHEIVHLVCPWREHDRQGLMAAILDRGTLTGSRVPFTRELRRDFMLGVDARAGAAFSVARGDASPHH